MKVDHSAFDSYMFIIEAEEKCIVHTGDFRVHGRLGKDFFKRLEEHLKGKNVDVLITEGTMMSRAEEGPINRDETQEQVEKRLKEEIKKENIRVYTEEELEKAAAMLLKNHKHAFVVCSSTNVDSLISFHNAAKKKGLKFYVSRYVYKQLEAYNKALKDMNRSELMFDLSEPDGKNDKKEATVCVISPSEKSQNKIEQLQMQSNGFVMLITNPYEDYRKFAKKFEEQQPILIHSVWDGYLEEGKPYTKKDNRQFYYGNGNDEEIFFSEERRHKLHTSGHAYIDDIKRMIKIVKPAEAIIPIHTERKEEFKRLKIDDMLDRVAVMNDGDTYYVGADRQMIADETVKLLEERKWEREKEPQPPEWVDRYKGYYDKIKENSDYIKAVCDCFDDTGHTVKYLSLDKVKKTNIQGRGHVFIDLRTAGVSVAELSVSPKKPDDVMKNGVVSKDKVRAFAEVKKFNSSAMDKVKKYIPKDKISDYENRVKPLFEKYKDPKWGNGLFDDYKGFNCNFKLIAEHPVETKLLSILDDKDKKGNKELRELKLCKLCGQFYQLRTPIKASHAHENILKYSGRNGGNIDILAYIDKPKPQEGRRELCIIELKDSYEQNETPEKAIKQAIVYAAFIIRLLRNDSGADWYKYFLEDKDAVLPDTAVTVNAVIAMPYPDNDRKNFKHVDFTGEEVKVGNDNIKLHYMFFEKTEQNELTEFKTSLFG